LLLRITLLRLVVDGRSALLAVLSVVVHVKLRRNWGDEDLEGR
jgi:hypothetical protein